MTEQSSAAATLEWLTHAVTNDESSNQNENSTPTSSTSNGSVEILTDDPNPFETNIGVSAQGGRPKEGTLININNINFDLTIKWKIRGVISFKYDTRHFNNGNGDGDIFSFDIRDNSGEITITSFNLSAKSIEPRIEKNLSYEITNLCIKTSNDAYKTLPNKYQLTTTNKTTITEIMPLEVMAIPYSFLKLADLESIDLNSVIDIQCRVVRDYGLSTGITNDRPWAKKEVHIMEGNNQCRLTLWNNQKICTLSSSARIIDGCLARSMIKCKYLKVKYFNGSKCLSSMDNSIIIINQDN